LKNSDSSVVVNFAAYTNVKKAEGERKEAHLLNVTGAENVARTCRELNKFLIYISTGFARDHGFGLTAYGQTKIEGEEDIKKVGGRLAIVRIDYPFGNPTSERDYIRKILWTMDKGYPLFAD
jgi:dTDP-4-dehydrorhamnose reductase